MDGGHFRISGIRRAGKLSAHLPSAQCGGNVFDLQFFFRNTLDRKIRKSLKDLFSGIVDRIVRAGVMLGSRNKDHFSAGFRSLIRRALGNFNGLGWRRRRINLSICRFPFRRNSRDCLNAFRPFPFRRPGRFAHRRQNLRIAGIQDLKTHVGFSAPVKTIAVYRRFRNVIGTLGGQIFKRERPVSIGIGRHPLSGILRAVAQKRYLNGIRGSIVSAPGNRPVNCRPVGQLKTAAADDLLSIVKAGRIAAKLHRAGGVQNAVVVPIDQPSAVDIGHRTLFRGGVGGKGAPCHL